MSTEKRLPEWSPPSGGDAFASEIREGIARSSPISGRPSGAPARAARSIPEPAELAAAVKEGDRGALARAITLVESRNPAHEAPAARLLQDLLDRSGNSIRIGITGVPGAGKSTLIESFGLYLCNEGRRVAVLAVDPSSVRTGGSILGDKTRMEELARHRNAFIRPSPTSGALGGVARKTRESLLLCEAAGFDAILVETVGVGQSEGLVRDMVDFYLLVLIAGAGDELQGMKRGVMELADAILINKADGENLPRARTARAELERVLHYLHPATRGWQTPARCCSALNCEGIPELWELIRQFEGETRASGAFLERRRAQNITWLDRSLEDELQRRFFARESVRSTLEELRKRVGDGSLAPAAALDELRPMLP